MDLLNIYNISLLFAFTLICILAYMVGKNLLTGEAFSDSLKSILQFLLNIFSIFLNKSKVTESKEEIKIEEDKKENNIEE